MNFIAFGPVAEKGEAYRKPFPGDKALSAGILGLSVLVRLIPCFL